jgi:hypothetical protein
MKRRTGVAEKRLQKSKEKYRPSHSKFERFEVKCLTPTKDVNVVYAFKVFVFSVFHLGILMCRRPLKLLL